ncbi:DUF3237 family protein [Reyranella massiliensis]|uniref:DUF3237 family protein n=1 Tax=Reyranella massiliensis TaxID=445220 RepID=UPI0002F1CD21|nr:DUF3237 family protein [Reyranella massiliensis]
MSKKVDAFIATAPGLRFAFAIKAKVGPVQDLGQTARGHRRIIDIVGGEVAGPRLDGEILPGGADWQIVRPDGTIEILARMSKGELVPFDSYHFRTAPRFETAEPSLKWLERATFVGVAARTPDRIAIGFHEVL